MNYKKIYKMSVLFTIFQIWAPEGGSRDLSISDLPEFLCEFQEEKIGAKSIYLSVIPGNRVRTSYFSADHSSSEIRSYEYENEKPLFITSKLASLDWTTLLGKYPKLECFGSEENEFKIYKESEKDKGNPLVSEKFKVPHFIMVILSAAKRFSDISDFSGGLYVFTFIQNPENDKKFIGLPEKKMSIDEFISDLDPDSTLARGMRINPSDTPDRQDNNSMILEQLQSSLVNQISLSLRKDGERYFMQEDPESEVDLNCLWVAISLVEKGSAEAYVKFKLKTPLA